jgi:crossover junction endodeoxyribonuclease RuvC
LLKAEKIILGIDPGTNIMGYGIIKVQKSTVELVEMGILNLEKYDETFLKLQKIFETTLRLIDSHHPDAVAAEAPFFGKNVQSMLKLGRAQGVALAAALYRNKEVFEYAPRKIKQSITGNGNASKEQVAAMMINLNLIKEIPNNLDATDGLAAALCHHYQNKKISGGKSYTGWKAFITENPKRV